MTDLEGGGGGADKSSTTPFHISKLKSNGDRIPVKELSIPCWVR